MANKSATLGLGRRDEARKGGRERQNTKFSSVRLRMRPPLNPSAALQPIPMVNSRAVWCFGLAAKPASAKKKPPAKAKKKPEPVAGE